MARGRKEIGLPKENGISFASFYCALKDAWNGKVSDCELINLLIGFVTMPAEVFNQNGDPLYIDSADASRIKTGKMNIQRTIREAREDCRVLSTIEDSFAKRVLPSLNSSKIGVMFQKVCPSGLFTACISWAYGTPPRRSPFRARPERRPLASIRSTLRRTARPHRRLLA